MQSTESAWNIYLNDMLQFPFDPFPVLSTPRLTLRAITAEDQADLHRLRSDERVNRYTYGKVYHTVEDIVKFMERTQQNLLEQSCIYWAITLTDEQKLIGTMCLFNFSPENGRIEIGYELHPDYHRKGIVQEAFVPVIDFGFRAMQAYTIEALPYAANSASVNLLEKFSFILKEILKCGFGNS
jgi:[ribosomal protein S5]-alanine N-acetyltransferase